MIRPDRPAEDTPTLKIAGLSLVQLCRELVDAREDIRGGKNICAKNSPAVHEFLAEIGVLEKPPKPGVLLIIQLRPVPVLGHPALLSVDVPKSQIPVPDRAHVDFAAAILVVEGAEAEAVHILGRFDQPVMIDE